MHRKDFISLFFATILLFIITGTYPSYGYQYENFKWGTSFEAIGKSLKYDCTYSYNTTFAVDCLDIFGEECTVLCKCSPKSQILYQVKIRWVLPDPQVVGTGKKAQFIEKVMNALAQSYGKPDMLYNGSEMARWVDLDSGTYISFIVKDENHVLQLIYGNILLEKKALEESPY